MPYTWIKISRDTVYPKPLAGPVFWHARGFPSEYNYKEDITEKKEISLSAKDRG